MLLSNYSRSWGPPESVLLHQSKDFRHLRIAIYALPLAENTTQWFIRLGCPASTCRITTNSRDSRFPSCLSKATCVINLPTNFDRVSPHPVLFLLVPLTVELLFAYGARLICQRTSRCSDRGIRLRSRLPYYRCMTSWNN